LSLLMRMLRKLFRLTYLSQRATQLAANDRGNTTKDLAVTRKF